MPGARLLGKDSMIPNTIRTDCFLIELGRYLPRQKACGVIATIKAAPVDRRLVNTTLDWVLGTVPS